jgi:hypothetical protein
MATEPHLLAYTQSEDKGERDLQTPIKPGRYLARFAGEILSADEIRSWVGQFAVAKSSVDVQFATTEDDIEAVFFGGPRSCMDGDHGHSACTRVYAAGDLAIAYLGEMEHATARVVTWPAKLIYSVIYGDDDKLKPALAALGYTRATREGFAGAKLLYEEMGTGFIAPYWDGSERASIEGGFLVLQANGGDFLLNCQDGVIGGTCCSCCGDRYDEEDGGTWYADEPWCQSCYEEYLSYCEGCDETVRSEEMVCVPGDGGRAHGSNGRYNARAHDRYLCGECADSETTECANCGDRRYSDLMLTLADGDEWCMDCAESGTFHCEHCDEHHESFDGMVTVDDDEVWCGSCAESDAKACGECGDSRSDIADDDENCDACGNPSDDDDDDEDGDLFAYRLTKGEVNGNPAQYAFLEVASVRAGIYAQF